MHPPIPGKISIFTRGKRCTPNSVTNAKPIRADCKSARAAEQLWYDFHARMYDPALGRFNGVDPKSQFASPYVGMGNNPVLGVDPDGEWVMQAIGAGVGLVTGYIGARKAGASVGEAIGQAVITGAIGFATGNIGSSISASLTSSIGGVAGA
jgi:RHS repeat-associated protein